MQFNRLLLVMVLVQLSSLSIEAWAQGWGSPGAYYRAPATSAGKTVIIPMGTVFEGRMDTTIGSSVSRPGQRFSIVMSSPVLANGVDVILPAGTQIMGEVVECIPSRDIPYQKPKGAPKPPKPVGKLRVQLNGLRTPDGVTYPLVASIMGEIIENGGRSANNPALGPGVAYEGTAANFAAVAPGVSQGRGWGRGPQVMRREQMLRDPIYGRDRSLDSMNQMGHPEIRALVRRGNDLFIDSGSAITVRLEAPFKISISSEGILPPTTGLDQHAPVAPDDAAGRKHFSPSGKASGTGSEPDTQPANQATVPRAIPAPDDSF